MLIVYSLHVKHLLRVFIKIYVFNVSSNYQNTIKVIKEYNNHIIV